MASKTIINVGSVPIQTFNRIIDFEKVHTYTVYGAFGLKFWSLKQVVTKCIKKTGRLRFKIFPQTPITKKPIEVRMGKGKGNVDHWVVKIKPGTMLCFIETNLIAVAKKALKYAQIRLPIKTKIILTN
eukprot:gene677-1298_t